MTRIGTYNLWAYGKYKSEVDRHRLVVSVVKTLGDVLLVQELYGGDDGQAGATLRQLADATGMRCEIAPGAYAAVAGGRLEASLGLGILWRDGIEPVPGTWRTVSEGRLWHALACLTLDVGGQHVTVASYHAAPSAGARTHARDAHVVCQALSLAGEVILGGSFGSPLAPGDPQWLSYVGPEGIFEQHGLRDAALVNGAALPPTFGHHPDSDGWPQRPDRLYATPGYVSRLRDFAVVDSPRALRASDHLPLTATLSPLT
jgi:endonuclease/exonuclease/phosphatase family metal-dependent hydrolase